MEQHSSSFRPRGPSMEEEASSSHMQPPPRAHRPFSPASPPSPTTAMTPPLLVRLPPELLRAVATAFLMAKERARLSLACRHCHDGRWGIDLHACFACMTLIDRSTAQAAWCRHTPRLALRPPPRGKRHTTPQSPLRVLLSRPARTQSLEQLTLHNAGWTLPALLAVLLGEGEGVGVVLPSLTHLELHTSNASPSSLPFTSVTAWGEEEEEGQRQHHLQLQQEEEEEEETGDPAMSVTRPLTRAMGVGLGQAMREGKLPALVKLGLRRVAMAGQGKQGEEGEVVAALIEGGLLPLPSSDGGGYPPCPRLAEFDLGGTYMGQQGAAALARACRLRGNVGGCCGLASLSLGWWEEAPGQQGRQQQTRLSSNGAEDGEQEEELLARVLCTAYCKGLRRLTLSTDIALTAKELGSVERYLREGGGGSLEVLSVEASSGAAGGGQEEEEEGDGGQGFLQVLQNIAVQAAQMQQHLQGLVCV